MNRPGYEQASRAMTAMARGVDEFMRDPEAVRERQRLALEQRDEPGMRAVLRTMALWIGEDATASYVASDPLPCHLGRAQFQGPFNILGKGETWAEALAVVKSRQG